jgi:hypothetical protein
MLSSVESVIIWNSTGLGSWFLTPLSGPGWLNELGSWIA